MRIALLILLLLGIAAGARADQGMMMGMGGGGVVIAPNTCLAVSTSVALLVSGTTCLFVR